MGTLQQILNLTKRIWGSGVGHSYCTGTGILQVLRTVYFGKCPINLRYANHDEKNGFSFQAVFTKTVHLDESALIFFIIMSMNVKKDKLDIITLYCFSSSKTPFLV